MFSSLSKVLALILDPLFIAVVLLLPAAFWIRKKPRLSEGIVFTATLLLWLSSTEWFSSWLIAPLEEKFPRNPPLEGIEAVVVLTGMVDMKLSGKEGIELNSSADRIIHGLAQARRLQGTRLIIVGGTGTLFRQEKSESALLSRHIASEFGFPEERIIVETRSRNTHENAVNAREILHKNSIKKAALITSASHMPRAFACFKRQGVEAIPFPVDYRSHLQRLNLFSFIPKAGSLKRTNYALHEYVGLMIYRLMGYI